MAVAIARALEEERHLVVEAGTGVGKSIAYVAPSILYAIAQKKKAIVSTHTINLQEQLLNKDIPILKKVLPVEFEAALMKGRQNYLCPRRLERALQQAGELFTTSEAAELARIAEWARTTRDGTLSDLAIEPDPKVWSQVFSEAHICTSKTFRQTSQCFFQQAPKRLLGGKGREVRIRGIDFVPDTISGRLMALQARVAEGVKRTEDEFLKAELQELGRRIHDARVGIVTFLEQGEEGHVYWVERTGKTAQFI